MRHKNKIMLTYLFEKAGSYEEDLANEYLGGNFSFGQIHQASIDEIKTLVSTSINK